MGCLQSKKRNRIVAMQTMNKDQVFTSTADIHQLYNFGKVLGVGSFGKVLLAKMKQNSEKQYAIKVIDKRRVKGREALLANEIFVLQQLDHPNIIKFYEVYQSPLYFYICMDYCQGGELVERIAKQQSTLSEGQVQNIIYKICSAIVYIHDLGLVLQSDQIFVIFFINVIVNQNIIKPIIHRDIKPENIMFSEKDIYSEPKLIDFGLANKYDTTHIKRLKTFVGTPLYLPPEVIDGEYDEKCDVWSLGVMLFSLLCGYPPFYGKNRAQLYENIKSQALIYDRRHWRNISEQVKDLIQKMLMKAPKKRLSARECLKHAWFQMQFENVKVHREKSQQLLTQTHEDNRTIYQMLKMFRGGAKFKKEVTKVLINQMNEKEIHHLKQVFQKIDVDNSGTITIEELREALQQEGSPASLEEIEQIIQTIVLEDDEENNNLEMDDEPSPLVIKYTDFLAACIDERKVLTREKLWSLFKYFDTLNVNYIQFIDQFCIITKEDIKEALARHGRQMSDEKIDQMIYEIDPNHDNKISFDEFLQMMGVAGIEQTMNIRDEVKEMEIQS